LAGGPVERAIDPYVYVCVEDHVDVFLVAGDYIAQSTLYAKTVESYVEARLVAIISGIQWMEAVECVAVCPLSSDNLTHGTEDKDSHDIKAPNILTP
jgi:hypothetical protein